MKHKLRDIIRKRLCTADLTERGLGNRTTIWRKRKAGKIPLGHRDENGKLYWFEEELAVIDPSSAKPVPMSDEEPVSAVDETVPTEKDGLTSFEERLRTAIMDAYRRQ